MVSEAQLPQAREEAESCRLILLTPAHPAYPLTLLTSADGPAVLYVEGDLTALAKPQLAIVGPRHADRPRGRRRSPPRRRSCLLRLGDHQRLGTRY